MSGLSLDESDRLTLRIADIDSYDSVTLMIRDLGVYIERTYRNDAGFDPAQSAAAKLLRKLVTPATATGTQLIEEEPTEYTPRRRRLVDEDR